MGTKQNLKKQRGLLFFSINIAMLLLLAFILIRSYGFGNLSLDIILCLILILISSYLMFNLLRSENQTNSTENIRYNNSTSTVNHSKGSEHIIEEKQQEFSKILLKGISSKTSKQKLTEKFLSNLVNNQEASIGLYYDYQKKSKTYKVAATYAYLSEEQPFEFQTGEGLNGQVVKNKKAMRINELPDNYTNIISGLGSGKPKYLLIYPVIVQENVIGVIEMASFSEFSKNLEEELTKFFESNIDKFLNVGDNS